ncbi:hypothetical protein QYM36_012086 [Artemia franciscana]|uniref:Uncharacterized protein n=1 Tax=Artemia franciscana TaxID=6661 RepID=A0AA88KX67_ARTSF|nr:hypothetical protein QYM36_012086 [Artemia franciscana]
MVKNHKFKGKQVDISVFCATEMEIHSDIPRFPKQRGSKTEYEREFTEDKGGSWRKQNLAEIGKQFSDRSNSTENNTWRNLGNKLTEDTSTGWRNPIQDGKSTWRSQKSASTYEIYRDNLSEDTNTSWRRNIHSKDVKYRGESTEDKGSSWRRKDMTETGNHLSDRRNSTESMNRRNLCNDLTEGKSTGWRNPIQDGKSTWRTQKSAGTDEVYRDNLSEDTTTSWDRNIHGKDVQYRGESTEDKGSSWRRKDMTETGKHLSDRSNSTESMNRRNLCNNLTEGTSTGWRNPIQDGRSTWSGGIDKVYRGNLTEDTDTSWGRKIHSKDAQYRRESTEGVSWRRKNMNETAERRDPIQRNRSAWESRKSLSTNYVYRENLTEDTDTRRRRNTHSKDVQYGRDSPEDKSGSWKRGKEKGLSDGSDSAECNSWKSLGKNLTEGTSIGRMDKNLNRGYKSGREVLGSRETSSKDEDAKETVKSERDAQECFMDPAYSIGNKSHGWGNGQNLRNSFTEDTTSNNQKINNWSSFCKDFPGFKCFSEDNHHQDKNQSTSESNTVSSRKNVLEGNDSGEDFCNILLTKKNMSKNNEDWNNPIEGSKTKLTSGSLFPSDNSDRNKPKGDVQKSNQDQSSSSVERSEKNYTCAADTATLKKDTATTTGKTNMSGNLQIGLADSLIQEVSIKTERRVSAEGKEEPLHRNVIDRPIDGNKSIKAELKLTTLPPQEDTNISYNKNTSKNPRVTHYTHGGARDNRNITEKYKRNGLCGAAASKYLSIRQKANNRFSLLQPEDD